MIKSSSSSTSRSDSLFTQILKSKDKAIIWGLLCEHIRNGNAARLRFVIDTYGTMTDAFLHEQYQPIKRASSLIEEERNTLKRQRKQEIVTMQRLDSMQMISRNTWYFLGSNACVQMVYGMKRINDPCREHVSNNFEPLPDAYRERFMTMRDDVLNVYERAGKMLQSGDFTDAEQLRIDSNLLQRQLSADRKQVLDTMQHTKENLTTLLLTVHILQESQELIGSLRHMIRGMNKFAGAEY